MRLFSEMGVEKNLIQYIYWSIKRMFPINLFILALLVLVSCGSKRVVYGPTEIYPMQSNPSQMAAITRKWFTHKSIFSLPHGGYNTLKIERYFTWVEAQKNPDGTYNWIPQQSEKILPDLNGGDVDARTSLSHEGRLFSFILPSRPSQSNYISVFDLNSKNVNATLENQLGIEGILYLPNNDFSKVIKSENNVYKLVDFENGSEHDLNSNLVDFLQSRYIQSIYISISRDFGYISIRNLSVDGVSQNIAPLAGPGLDSNGPFEAILFKVSDGMISGIKFQNPGEKLLMVEEDQNGFMCLSKRQINDNESDMRIFTKEGDIAQIVIPDYDVSYAKWNLSTKQIFLISEEFFSSEKPDKLFLIWSYDSGDLAKCSLDTSLILSELNRD